MSVEVAVKRLWKGGFSLDVSFRTNGGVLGILGASGCGKSMTLKAVAGIESPSEGRITVGGRVLYDSAQRINLKPQQRKIGYLFQHYALFPNMTVAENIGCALHGKEGREVRIGEMTRRFQLEGLEQRYPGQLSGGQQQRVALARILAYEPDALLLDEPFSALDAYLREQLQVELLDLLQDYRGDVILVTHSRDEVFHLCQNLMVMERGRCIASGETKAMFRDPKLLTVARLTGCKNFSRARIAGEGTLWAEDWGVTLRVDRPIPEGTDYIGVRAHHFRPAEAGARNAFPIAVRERLESPFEWNILFTRAGRERSRSVWWMITKEKYRGETPEYLTVRPEDILLLRSEGEAAE